MKTLLVLLSALFIAGCAPKQQTNEASEGKYTVEGTISVSKECDIEWLTRYEDKHIKALHERAAVEPSECDVMFFGSSSIRRWKSLAEDMAPLTVVNRGYGGATLRDLHYNYATVMAHYKPKAFVFYCDNDLRTKPEIDIPVGELFDLVRMLFGRIEKDYPGVPIYFLAMKHCKRREAIRDRQAIYNALMKEYAERSSNQVIYVDTCTPLLTEDGQIDTTLFVKDNIHLNAEGYKRWTKILRELLIK
jgi:lysophospholipase L1-like esterase